MDGRFCNFHFAGLSGQKEIDVVDFAVRSAHIYAGEVFAAAEIGESIVVHSYEVEGEILALILDVKFPVAALLCQRKYLFPRRLSSGAPSGVQHLLDALRYAQDAPGQGPPLPG